MQCYLLLSFHFVHFFNVTCVLNLCVGKTSCTRGYAGINGGGIKAEGGKVFTFGTGGFDGVVGGAGDGAGDAGGSESLGYAGLTALEFVGAGGLGLGFGTGGWSGVVVVVVGLGMMGCGSMDTSLWCE